MSNSRLNIKRALAWRIAATILLVAGGALLLALNRRTVSALLAVARQADAVLLVYAVMLMLCTFCIASATYGVLALHPLRYRQTLLVELATSFANRLLPAGLGGLGLNGIYLFRRKHTPAEATAVVSVNNLIGMIGHLLLLMFVLVIEPRTVRELFSKSPVHARWWLIAFVVAALVVIVLNPALRQKIVRFGLNIMKSVRKETTRKLCMAVLLAMLLTMTYTLLLTCVARSLGISLNILQIFIIFSVGMLVGTATPTPGGLVGVEAGMFTGFVAYGLSNTDAGAAVLLYRLVTYWLPIVPGLGALVVARKNKLL